MTGDNESNTDNYNYDQIGNHLGNGYTMTTTNRQSNLSYDVDGNLLSDGALTYQWDGENRLKRICDGQLWVDYSYDYANRRYASAADGVAPTGSRFETAEYYVYDDTKMILRHNPDNWFLRTTSYACIPPPTIPTPSREAATHSTPADSIRTYTRNTISPDTIFYDAKQKLKDPF